MEYWKADKDVLDLVESIADAHHERLGNAAIAVIMREKAKKEGGVTVPATASLPSAALKPLFGETVDFVITIGSDAWQAMTQAQRAACIDHELCHFGFDAAGGSPCLIPHDLEEFASIVQRHGAWRNSKRETAVQLAFVGLTVQTSVRVTTGGMDRAAE